MERIDVEHKDGVRIENTTTVTWSEMAEAVAHADSHGQAQFFEHLAIHLAGARYGFCAGKWAMQCRAICEEPGWIPLNRSRIASQMETLAEHMRETATTGA